MKPSSSPGFSLLEILIALGIIAIATAIVLHLFPLAQRIQGEGHRANSSTFLAQRIVSTLEASLPQGAIATAPDWLTNPSHCLRVQLDQPSQHYIAYDAQGRPRRELTKIEYEAPLHEEEITQVASIIVTTAGQPPGTAHIAITISTPVKLAHSQRHHLLFSLLLSTSTAPVSDGTPPANTPLS